MSDVVVVCADVGSVARNKFAWWSSAKIAGNSPQGLALYVSEKLNAGEHVALGFECPLFVPLSDDAASLGKARLGEGQRSWSAGAGCGALATGLVQVAWVLREIKSLLSRPSAAFLDWDEFRAADSALLLWEAFVTDEAKGRTDQEDAQRGAEAFIRSLPYPVACSAVTCETEVYSLIGAAILRAGWSDDSTLLRQACLVLRACDQNA